MNYFDKSVEFKHVGVSRDKTYMSANQVITSMKENAQVYMILAHLEIESQVTLVDTPIV